MNAQATGMRMRWLALGVICGVVGVPLGLAQEVVHTLSIDTAQVQRSFDPQRLTGTNVALWIGPKAYESPRVQRLLRDSEIAYCRMPGGSWSDVTFWNGNGVRDAQGRVDPTRMKDGYPAIDYSAYAPTITVEDKHPHTPKTWCGNVDVKQLHDFLLHMNVAPLVCVNAGTGRARDAEEWVRWANRKNPYNVRYWEVGNELDGGWEAGHYLADGRELTPEMYAQRYSEFAQMIKAIDPTTKVGGPASGVEEQGSFAEAMLRDIGGLVDFISIHTYPGSASFSDEQQFARVGVVKEQVARARKWIAQYQPARKDKIEVGFTEWNLPATRVCCDLDGALWSALFLREMALNGVDFAYQWDAFTHGKGDEGGHALIYDPEGEALPKAQYWAFSLWNHNTGNQILASGKVEGTGVEYLATRNGQASYLMLVNTSRTQEALIRPELSGAPKWGYLTQLTYRQYFWDPFAHKPDWDYGPSRPIPVAFEHGVKVPPFSLSFIKVENGAASSAPAAEVVPAKPSELRLLMPKEVFAGEEAEVWVRAYQVGTDLPADDRDLADAIVMAGQDVTISSPSVRLKEAAGRTLIRCSTPGTATLTARSGQLMASGQLMVKPSVPRPVMLWDAEEPTLDRDHGYESDWPLAKEMNVRPNEPVVRVDPQGAAKSTHQLLLRVSIPEQAKLDRSGIRGVFADIRVSPDFRCDDPNAHIEVVMQSEADWWMPLGNIPCDAAMKADWKHEEIKVTQEKHQKAMFQARNVWFVLRSDKPVRGSIYFDRMGLLIR